MSREDLIQEIVENLVRSQRPVNFAGWQKIGFSHAQMGMLFMLSYHKSLQIKQISEYLGISKSAASQMIVPLIRKGLVSRQVDPQDRRIAHLSLSPKAADLIKKLHKAKYAGFRTRLEGLSADELRRLAEISRKLASAPETK